MGKLRVVPLTLKQANQLVGLWHRHHGLVVGHRWSIGVEVDGGDLGWLLVGAAIVGRPKARMTNQYMVLRMIVGPASGDVRAGVGLLLGASIRISGSVDGTSV